MSPDKENSMDQLLRQKLFEAKSAMPEGLLERVLDAKRRQKRRMLFWLNTAILLYVLGLFSGYNGFYSSRNATKPAKMDSREHASLSTRNSLENQEMPAKSYAQRSEKNSDPLGNMGSFNFNEKNEKKRNEGPLGGGKANVAASSISQNTSSGTSDMASSPSHSNGDVRAADNSETRMPSAKIPEPVIAHDSSVQTIMAQNPTNSAVTTDTKKDKVKKGKSSNPPKPQNYNFDVWMGLGWEKSNQKLQLNEFDPKFYHRDFRSLLSSAVGDLTGSSFAVGVRGMYKEKLTFQAGFQLTQMRNHFVFNYTVKDIPILDTSNQYIVGYKEIPDSLQQKISIDRNVSMNSFSIPFQLGYTYHPSKNWQVTGSVGFRPEFHFATEFVLPGQIGLTGLHYQQISKYFTMPMTLSLGIYRKEERFTYGIMGRMCPQYSKNIALETYGKVQYRSMDIGFQIMYNFSGNTGKRK